MFTEEKQTKLSKYLHSYIHITLDSKVMKFIYLQRFKDFTTSYNMGISDAII